MRTSKCASERRSQSATFFSFRRRLRFEPLEDRRLLSVDLVSKAAFPSLTAAGDSHVTSVSADGRYVAFSSKAANLVSGMEIAPGIWNVYRLDRETGEIELVSVNAAGTGGGNFESYASVISADGSVVAFTSTATNLHALPADGRGDVFARNLVTGTTHLVSINARGTGGDYGESGNPVVSADGSIVVFESSASDLHALDTNVVEDVYARNLLTNTTHLVSVNRSGNGSGDGRSYSPVISSDGTIVAFESDAENLHALDTNFRNDVFARNVVTGTTFLVSINAAGTGGGNSHSRNPSISADGTVVAFESDARDLHALDMDSGRDAYARNLVTGTTHLVSINSDGTGSGFGTSRDSVISADGSIVAFVSNAVNLHPLRAVSHSSDVFARNIITGTTYLVSVNAAGNASVPSSYLRPVISAGGSVVVFTSGAANHHALDTNGGTYGDVFARNLLTGTTYVASVNAAGTGSGNHNSHNPVISADGSVIAFVSDATNLVNGDGNTHPDVFARDISSGTTQLISKAHPSLYSATAGSNSSANPGALSADGRYVAFVSRATNLVSGLEVVPGVQNVYRLDRVTGDVLLVSVNAHGTGGGNSYSYEPVISADGNVVAFRSTASNLHSLDTYGTLYDDIYARNLATGTTHLVSINALGDGSGNDDSFEPVISADGNVVAFQSRARNLHNLDKSSTPDVFARNLTTGTTYLVSINAAGTGGGNDDSGDPVISADGTIVAFESSASNLHPLDPYDTSDVFARNIVTGTTFLVSVNAGGTSGGTGTSQNPSISAKGDVVAFQSSATNLHPLDTSVGFDIYARNIGMGTTYLVSVNAAGTGGGEGPSENPVISADGRVIAFQSQARNLHPLDTDFHLDVVARNLETDTTYLVSNGSGIRSSSGQVINADGSVVAFVSTARNLHPLDNNFVQDVFARNLTAATTYLISTNSTSSGSGNNTSSNPVISASGTVVAFSSSATDLVLADFNSSDDVFLGQGPALPADYNNNNLVDAADYVVWRKTLNQTVAHFSGADGDGDGVVDEDDYGVWRANFGRAIGAEGAGHGTGGHAATALETPVAAGSEVQGYSSGVVAQSHIGTVAFEPSRSPSLSRRGTTRALELHVAARRDSALVALFAERSPAPDVEDSSRTSGHMDEKSLRESQFLNVLEDAFASWGFGNRLSSFGRLARS